MKMEFTNTARGRKRSTILALILVIAILLTGTLAWQGIRQRVINPDEWESGVGGRVHDDFDAESGNKDVYFENYGAVPIFVRLRLSEFMSNNGVSFAPGAVWEDPDTWTIHIPLPGQPTMNETTYDRQFRDYATWEFGGDKIFMPTHNRDNRCPETVASGDAIDRSANGQTALGGNDGMENFWEEGDRLTETLRTTNGGQTADVEHVAKPTIPHTVDVRTVSQWRADVANGAPANGPFWVIDYDGWAYWMELLQPGEATSLLLDQINVDRDAGAGHWRYAIHVDGEFTTEAAGCWSLPGVPNGASGSQLHVMYTVHADDVLFGNARLRSPDSNLTLQLDAETLTGLDAMLVVIPLSSEAPDFEVGTNEMPFSEESLLEFSQSNSFTITITPSAESAHTEPVLIAYMEYFDDWDMSVATGGFIEVEAYLLGFSFPTGFAGTITVEMDGLVLEIVIED